MEIATLSFIHSCSLMRSSLQLQKLKPNLSIDSKGRKITNKDTLENDIPIDGAHFCSFLFEWRDTAQKINPTLSRFYETKKQYTFFSYKNPVYKNVEAQIS